MRESVTIGNVEILSLTDAEVDFPINLSGLFPGVPAAAWAEHQQRFPGSFAGPDTWHVHFGSHLIRSGGQSILVDTGVGANPAPLLGGKPGMMMADLKAAGIDTEDIDTVFMTHAHPDHVGWT